MKFKVGDRVRETCGTRGTGVVEAVNYATHADWVKIKSPHLTYSFVQLERNLELVGDTITIMNPRLKGIQNEI